jgi:hypothetical protein
MNKKKKKDKKPRAPRVNSQLPISQLRKIVLTGPRYHLEKAREYPLLGCWVYKEWQERGIAPVVVARKQSEDRVLYGVYMIDMYCLGIKDCYTRTDVSLAQFERDLPKLCAKNPEPCSVEFAHELVYGAMEYAKGYGFDPHLDFTGQLANMVLDPPDAHPRTHTIEFGKDGKPFYVSGPYDDERKINRVLNTLNRTAGEGNFHFLAGFGGMDMFDDELGDELAFDDPKMLALSEPDEDK